MVGPGSSLLDFASEDPGVLIPPGAIAFILAEFSPNGIE